MNRSELREFVRTTSEMESHVITDDEIDSYLNEGFGRVVATAHWPWLNRSLSRVADPFVSLGEPASGVVSVFVGHDMLREVSSSRMQQLVLSGRDVRGPGVFSFEIPTVADTFPQVRIYPYPTPRKELVVDFVAAPVFGDGDSDAPVWAAMFHSVLADWALHRIWEKEEDMDLSDQYRQRYAVALSEMIRHYRVSAVNEPDVLEMTGGGDGSS